MRSSYSELARVLSVGVLLSAVAVGAAVFAASAPQSRQQRALELAAARLADRMHMGVVTVVETERPAFVYIAEDDILEGPLPMLQALYMQGQYRDADAQLLVEGTRQYRWALREVEHRRPVNTNAPALRAIAQAVHD